LAVLVRESCGHFAGASSFISEPLTKRDFVLSSGRRRHAASLKEICCADSLIVCIKCYLGEIISSLQRDLRRVVTTWHLAIAQKLFSEMPRARRMNCRANSFRRPYRQLLSDRKQYDDALRLAVPVGERDLLVRYLERGYWPCEIARDDEVRRDAIGRLQLP
jgi:hypothetical protein